MAANYDVTADNDDGSCLYNGCIDPYATNYNPTAVTDPNVDTICFSLNKTWTADSYIVEGVQYISSSSVTLIYTASSPTEGNFEFSGVSYQGDVMDWNGTYVYNESNSSITHTDVSNTSFSSLFNISKYTTTELDLEIPTGIWGFGAEPEYINFIAK